MKFIIKYWTQITGVLTILGFLIVWSWRLAAKIEANANKEVQFEQRVAGLERQNREQSDTLNDHDRRLIRLETAEELREKEMCKK